MVPDSAGAIHRLDQALLCGVLALAGEPRAACVCQAWRDALRGDGRALEATLAHPRSHVRSWVMAVQAAEDRGWCRPQLAMHLLAHADVRRRLLQALAGGAAAAHGGARHVGFIDVAAHAAAVGACAPALAAMRMASRAAALGAGPAVWYFHIRTVYHRAAHVAGQQGIRTLRALWARAERKRLMQEHSGYAGGHTWHIGHAGQAGHARYSAAATRSQQRARDLLEVCLASMERAQLGEGRSAPPSEDVWWLHAALTPYVGQVPFWASMWRVAPTVMRCHCVPRLPVLGARVLVRHVIAGARTWADVRALEAELGQDVITLGLRHCCGPGQLPPCAQDADLAARVFLASSRGVCLLP